MSNVQRRTVTVAPLEPCTLNPEPKKFAHLQFFFIFAPSNRHTIDQRNSNWNTPYTFSGKEKDVETGYGYFGARYYDSGLSIWLSVDPMSDKYPSMSPYNYCANNPIILVDPDGRDYETVIVEGKDGKPGTITIIATFYTNNDNKKTVQEALDVWNDQSGKHSFVNSEGKEYKVNFCLQVDDSDSPTISDVGINVPAGGLSNNVVNFLSPEQYQGQEDFSDIEIGSSRGKSDGKIIDVNSKSPFRTLVHEVGHNLGLDESRAQNPFNVMESGGTGTSISSEHVAGILNRNGFSVLNSSNRNQPLFYQAKTNGALRSMGNLKQNF